MWNDAGTWGADDPESAACLRVRYFACFVSWLVRSFTCFVSWFVRFVFFLLCELTCFGRNKLLILCLRDMYAADAPRIVLIIDVWHPDLSAQEVGSDSGTVWRTASSVTLAVVGVAM